MKYLQEREVDKKPQSRRLAILVVEDEPVTRKFIQFFLERFGHIVSLASDGYQAYTLWEEGNYDLILMDIQMPGIQGDEVVRIIRQQEQENHIPIIAVTANISKQSRESFLEIGCDGYVAKPFQLEELIAEIERVTVVIADTSNGARESAAAAAELHKNHRNAE